MGEGGRHPLAPQLLPDARYEILAALEWLDRPLSIADLMAVLDYRRSASMLAYHLAKLVDESALEVAATRPFRGGRERLFFFSTWEHEAPV